MAAIVARWHIKLIPLYPIASRFHANQAFGSAHQRPKASADDAERGGGERLKMVFFSMCLYISYLEGKITQAGFKMLPHTPKMTQEMAQEGPKMGFNGRLEAHTRGQKPRRMTRRGGAGRD